MLKKYLWVFIEKFSVILIKFITIMVMARFILPKDFGIFAIANYMIITATLFIDSGMGGSLIRKKNSVLIDYTTINIFCIIMSIVVGLIIFFGAYLAANFYRMPELIIILQILIISLFFRAITVVYVARMSKQMLFRQQAFIYSSAAIISSIFAIVLAYLSYGYWALIFQQIVEAIMIFIFFRIFGRELSLNNKFSLSILKEHLNFGIKLTLSSVIEAFSSNFIIHQITRIGGVNTVGEYTQTSRINEIFLGVIVTTIDKAALPIFVNKGQDLNEMIKIATRLLAIISLIVYYIISVMISSAEPIVRLVLGLNWIDSAWMLKVICYCGFFQIVEIILRSLLKAQGKSNFILFYSILKIVAVITVLSLIYIYFNNVEYLLYGLVFLSVFNIFIYFYLFKKLFDIKVSDFISAFYKPLFSAIISIFTTMYISNYIVWDESIFSSILNVAFNALLIAIIYFLILKVMICHELNYIKDLVVSFFQEKLMR